MREGCRTLTEHCGRPTPATPGHLRLVVERSIGLVTALTPTIGYEQSSAIAAEALRTGRPIVELVLERSLLAPAELGRLLSPANLVGPRRGPPPARDPDLPRS